MNAVLQDADFMGEVLAFYRCALVSLVSFALCGWNELFALSAGLSLCLNGIRRQRKDIT